MKRISLILMISMLVCLCITGCGAVRDTDETIKIGTVFELSGSNEGLGKSTLDGIKLAVKEINAQGGIMSRQVELINEDNKSNEDDGIAATRKLIEQDNVVAILGSVSSSIVLAEAPIAQAAGIPWMAATATNPQVTKVGEGVFRVCFIDSFQGSVLAKFAVEGLHSKRAAIMRDITSDYSKGLIDAFRANYVGEIVAEEGYAQQDSDFTAQLNKIKKENPDVLFIPGYYLEAGQIIKQARECGITATILGGDAWDSPELINIAGEAAEGCYFSNHYTNQDTSESVKSFIKRFKKEYNHEPDAFAALGYEAAQVLCHGISEAKSLDGIDINRQLARTSEFESVTGKITLDSWRNGIKSAVILQIKDGKPVFVKKINP